MSSAAPSPIRRAPSRQAATAAEQPSTTPPAEKRGSQQSSPPGSDSRRSASSTSSIIAAAAAAVPWQQHPLLQQHYADHPPPPTPPPTDFSLDLSDDDTRELDALKEQLMQPVHAAAAYLDNFEGHTKADHVCIGSLTLEQIEQEERRLQSDIQGYEQSRMQLLNEREQRLLQKTIEARKHLAQEIARQRTTIHNAAKLLHQRRRLEEDQLQQAFRRAETRLLEVLQARQAEVKTTYGELTIADGVYGGNKQRRWRLDWQHTPQPIQIRVDCLRGLRDKAPKGRYVVSASLYDRLGGSLMRWSRLRGQDWCGATLPFEHGGKFFNLETTINQNLFTVCPSASDIQPSMVLVLELFLLRSNGTPSDKAVGWSAFPLVNSEFDIAAGVFKAPLLRGERDPMLDRHADIEERIHTNLDLWLCNVYFELKRLPRYTEGQKEHEVELQYGSSLLGFPGRPLNSASPESLLLSHLGGRSQDEKAGRPQCSQQVCLLGSRPGTPTAKTSPMSQGSLTSLQEIRQRRQLEHQQQRQEILTCDDNENRPPVASPEANLALEPVDKVSLDAGLSYRVHQFGPQRLYAMNGEQPSARSPGMSNLDQASAAGKLATNRAEQLERHVYSVRPQQLESYTDLSFQNKSGYILRQLRAELGWKQARTSGFWISMLCLVLAFWARLYVHYVCQYLFLTALRLPVSEFAFHAFTVDLNYQSTLLLVREELGVVCIGPLGIFALLLLFIAIAAISKKLAGFFIDAGYRFIFAWGLYAVLDPWLILVVDLCYQRWRDGGGAQPTGDAFKLYWLFARSDDGGTPGAFLTLFAYVVLTLLAVITLYIYLLRLHMDGRVVDLYQRLSAAEDVYVLPYDHEISQRELLSIVYAAERWRGRNGERRKIAVYDYLWREHVESEANPGAEASASVGSDSRSSMTSPTSVSAGSSSTSPSPTKDRQSGEESRLTAEQSKAIGVPPSSSWPSTGAVVETTTHVSVHTLYLDGTRELYRQFLRLPDGAVVEVFGDMSGRLDRRVRQTLTQANVDVVALNQEATAFINRQFRSVGTMHTGQVLTEGGLLAPSSRRISTMSFIGPGSTELPEVIKPRTSLDFVRGGSLRRRATKDGSPPKARSSQHSLSPLGNNRPFQPHNSSTVMEEEASEA